MLQKNEGEIEKNGLGFVFGARLGKTEHGQQAAMTEKEELG